MCGTTESLKPNHEQLCYGLSHSDAVKKKREKRKESKEKVTLRLLTHHLLRNVTLNFEIVRFSCTKSKCNHTRDYKDSEVQVVNRRGILPGESVNLTRSLSLLRHQPHNNALAENVGGYYQLRVLQHPSPLN